MLLNIQVLRAVAAYLVVSVHLGTLLVATGVSRAPPLIGNCGVDLFFVISGYLMVFTTVGHPPSAGAFLVNRIVRVVPLYWVCTLVVFVVALVLPHLLISTTVTAISLSKSLLFIPFVRQSGAVQPILFLGWTLNYEMFFYLLFSASLLLPPVRSVTVALLVISALPVLGWLFAPSSLVERFYADPIMLEFAMGMILAVFLDRWGPVSMPAGWALIVVGGVVMLGRYHFVPLGERAWWSGIPATAILFGAISLELRGSVWRNGLVQLLGASSYSLYLVHPFVIQAFTKLFLASPIADSPVLLVGAVPLVLVLAGMAAIALHWTIERPLTRRLRGLVGHRASAAPRRGERNASA